MTVDGITYQLRSLNSIFGHLKVFVWRKDRLDPFVGPENALVAGIVDSFEARWSKDLWSSQDSSSVGRFKRLCDARFMNKYAVPTAKFATFSHSDSAIEGASRIWVNPSSDQSRWISLAGKGSWSPKQKTRLEKRSRWCLKKAKAPRNLRFLSGAEYSLSCCGRS